MWSFWHADSGVATLLCTTDPGTDKDVTATPAPPMAYHPGLLDNLHSEEMVFGNGSHDRPKEE